MRRRTARVVTALAVAVALVVAVIDLVVEPVGPPAPPSAPARVSPVAGTWTCVVGDGRDGTELTVSVARPGTPGQPPATVELTSFEDGQLRSRTLPQLFPGSHSSLRLVGGEVLGVWTRWWGGPVAVQREWRLDDAEELPPGTVAGGCPRAIADSWVIPGLATSGGSDARIRLANPFRTDATVAVGFLTPAGPEEPIALRNLTVPARSVQEIEVNAVLPEQDDLAAVVEVAAGRVAVEGYQLTRSAIGDVDGVSLLSPSTAAAEDWTVPWVADREEVASWLWVANLGTRDASVELTLNTRFGGIVPEGLAEVMVPAESLRRIDLRRTLPAGLDDAAITVRSDGAPVHVSAATRIAADEVADTGFAVQLGAPETSGSWVVTGGAVEGRTESLRLVNPGSEPAVVDLTLFDGVTVRAPDRLRQVTVPAGSLRTIDLTAHLGEAVTSWSAFVAATSGELVVGRLGSGGEDALHLVAVPGTAAAAWQPVGTGRAARSVSGLVGRIGTVLGVHEADPFAPPPVAPEPPPAPEGLDEVPVVPDGEGG